VHLLRTIVSECLRCAMNVHPTVALQVRAEPDRRVGAAVLVLGTLWGKHPRRGSAGDAAKAPARGGGQALPDGLRP
jgi:hypothetical protein